MVTFQNLTFQNLTSIYNAMYTLLSGLYKSLTEKDEFFVLILGLDNAGKTTFLEAAKTQFGKDNRAKRKRRGGGNGDKTPLVNPAKITTTVGLNIGRIDTDGIRYEIDVPY